MSGSALAPIVEGVLCVLTVAVLGWAVVAYRGLVRLRNEADTCWARIDVQLKRRHDLVPRLLESVRGAAADEPGTRDAVMAARGDATALVRVAGPAARAAAEGTLTRALGRLLALAEASADLRADHDFASVRAELADTEDRIAHARQFLTGAVRSYNRAVRSLPTSLVAALAGFRARESFPAPGDPDGRLTGSG